MSSERSQITLCVWGLAKHCHVLRLMCLLQAPLLRQQLCLYQLRPRLYLPSRRLPDRPNRVLLLIAAKATAQQSVTVDWSETAATRNAARKWTAPPQIRRFRAAVPRVLAVIHLARPAEATVIIFSEHVVLWVAKFSLRLRTIHHVLGSAIRCLVDLGRASTAHPSYLLQRRLLRQQLRRIPRYPLPLRLRQ